MRELCQLINVLFDIFVSLFPSSTFIHFFFDVNILKIPKVEVNFATKKYENCKFCKMYLNFKF